MKVMSNPIWNLRLHLCFGRCCVVEYQHASLHLKAIRKVHVKKIWISFCRSCRMKSNSHLPMIPWQKQPFNSVIASGNGRTRNDRRIERQTFWKHVTSSATSSVQEGSKSLIPCVRSGRPPYNKTAPQRNVHTTQLSREYIHVVVCQRRGSWSWAYSVGCLHPNGFVLSFY